MNANTRTKRILSVLLAFVLVFSLIPFSVSAADTGRTADTIFFATDRHEETSKFNSLLKALAYEPGLVVLGGDHVNNTNSGSLASITSEIHSVYPNADTFYTYAAHDANVSADSSNPYAYARTGEVYEGDQYYVYGVDQNDMQSSSSAATASANFVSWAASADSDKVIFVMCHMPIHSRRGDNAGGATWMNALNQAGEDRDIVYLWGHNHTGESSADTSVYFVGVGGSLTPQGGSTGTINFTYMNAGYIKNGYASQVVVNGDCVDVTRYNTSGSATTTYSIERRFATSHTWEVTETVAATCTADGYTTSVCADCGETKNTVVSATGHDYDYVVKDTCTGSYTVYTCAVCGHSYSEANPTETTYDQASSLAEGESYVIVASNYALTYGSSAGRTSVSASGGSITSDVSDAMVWTYENGKLYNDSTGTAKYINLSGSSSRRTITFSTSGASVSYSSSKLKLGSYYLYHSNSSGFSARTSGSTVTLYQVNEAFGGTGAHTYESVTVDATCTTDGSVTYTCTSCGDTYSEVIPATGSHTNEVVTVAATCTEAGSVSTTCTVCGETTIEVIEALGHDYASVTTAATCTEAGCTTYTCATCADSYTTDQVAALGHSYTSVITATCTEAGYEVFTCGTCGHSYQGNAVAALGHSYTTSTVAPTCTADGYTAYLCSVCGESHIGDTVAALGHNYNAVVTEATCIQAGFTTFTCTVCDHNYVGDEVEALGHDYESVVTAPTFTEMGYTTHTCKVCGDVTVDSYVPVLQHTYESVTVEPTCTEAGSVTYTCVECGDTYCEVIPALGHDYKTVTTEATCTQAGSVVTTCAVCGDEKVEALPALGHSYETVTVAPTCTENGYTTHTCACGDIRTETIQALGHDYNAVVTAPTCTEAGFTTYTCAVCGDSYTADQVAALGHDYSAVVTAPTCTEAGFTTYACAVCGDSYTADQVAALGHDYSAVITAPTCTEAGFTTYTCSLCGDSYVGAQTAALGHSYTTQEVDGYLVYTCACGYTYSEKLTAELSYNKVSAFASGDAYVITVYSGSKYYALSHAGNTLSAVQVTVSGDQITSEITEDLLWDYNGGKLSYEEDGTTYYLYAQPASGWFAWFSAPTLTVSTSNSSAVSISSNKLKVGSYYLRYSSSKFSLNRSATTAYLFEQTEA